MIRRLKDEMYEADGSKMFPEKKIETLPVEFTATERELYDDVTEYITEHYNLASKEENDAAGFAMVLYQKRLVSSIHAIRKSLKTGWTPSKQGVLTPATSHKLRRACSRSTARSRNAD